MTVPYAAYYWHNISIICVSFEYELLIIADCTTVVIKLSARHEYEFLI